MGAGVWAGFGESVQDFVKENRDYMKRKTERLENLILTQGTKAVSSAKGRVTDALSYKDALIARGVTLAAANGIFEESGLAGLKSVYDKLNTRKDLLPKHLQAFSNFYEEKFSGDESSASDYITDQMNSSLGLVPSPIDYQGELGTETEESSLAASIFGLDDSAYRDVLTSASPTTGLSGTQTLAAIGLYDMPIRGKGSTLDYDALPGKPWPITEHEDDLDLIGDMIDTKLQTRVDETITMAKRKTSTNTTIQDEYREDKANFELLYPELKYETYLTNRQARLEALISDANPAEKLKDYYSMGTDAQSDILNVFRSFDIKGQQIGYRNRILDNTVLPSNITNFYSSIPEFSSVAEVDAKQANDPTFKNLWIKLGNNYKYLTEAD